MYAYYLIMQQKGEGCDYSIGCGTKVKWLKGDTLDEAKQAVVEYFSGDGSNGYGPGEHHELEDAMIVRFEWDALPILKEKLAFDRAAEDAEIKKVQEARERAELDRLQRKYKQ